MTSVKGLKEVVYNGQQSGFSDYDIFGKLTGRVPEDCEIPSAAKTALTQGTLAPLTEMADWK